MSIARLNLLLVVAVALLVALPGGAGAARMQSCGGGVRAAQVPCSKAKRIATEYAKTGAHSLQGYSCSSGGSQGRCTLDRKIVLFPLR
jgi:hypothetical protein